MPEKLLECAFLIPLVRDSDRQSHEAVTWKLLQDALFDLCGGYTGGETMYQLASSVPGAYEEEGTSRSVEDQSLRYIVAISKTHLAELRKLLGRAANTFDQKSVYLSIAGHVEFVNRCEADGFLS